MLAPLTGNLFVAPTGARVGTFKRSLVACTKFSNLILMKKMKWDTCQRSTNVAVSIYANCTPGRQKSPEATWHPRTATIARGHICTPGLQKSPEVVYTPRTSKNLESRLLSNKELRLKIRDFPSSSSCFLQHDTLCSATMLPRR